MIEVRSGPLGQCVHATRGIRAGEFIISGWGEVVPRRTRHSLQVGEDEHVIIRNEIELMNHSCDPNCGVLVRREAETLEIYALRDIAAGEELAYDYASFEDTPEYLTGPCLCGSPICRGRMTGYAGLPPERRAALAGYIAPHLLGEPVGSPIGIELGGAAVGEPVGSTVG